MKRNTYAIFLALSLCLFNISCNEIKAEKESANNISDDSIKISTDEILVSSVMSREEQEKLTPDEVISLLKAGNKDFAEDNLTIRNSTQRVRDAAIGQYPYAAVLSCMDSRVPVEDVFHCGIGDLFVARVAGNIVDDDILGSLEYACKVSGSKLILVLGHEYCGAIKSAIDGVKLGNITSLLSKIDPSVQAAAINFDGPKTSKNTLFVEKVCDNNVENSIAEIRIKSPILKELEDRGAIRIIGGVYDMKTGEVDFFD